MIIAFENPGYLFLISVVIALLIFSMRFMVMQNKKNAFLKILVRAVLATVLILVLAQPFVSRSGKEVATVFLVDLSDSVREQQEEAIRFINESVKEKKRHDEIAVITFGKKPQIEQQFASDISLSEFQTGVVDNATDLEEAVRFALSQMPEGSGKRVVLLTDGNETEGDLKDTASTVLAQGCDFFVYKLAQNSASEVYISNLSMPKETGIGENFNITVEVESNVACQATVSLFSGRTLKGRQDVFLQKGNNRFVFMDTHTDEGLKTYQVRVDANADTVTVNNEYSAYTNIAIDKPILVVEGETGQSDVLGRILHSMGKRYLVTAPETVPNKISDFLEYSAIIFVDVYADDLRLGFTDCLEEYIKEYGGGFVVTGGKNSFALGNYKDTMIETVLPVDMDLQGENERPVMAMQLIIDQSGSMSSGDGFVTKLDVAKEAALAALKNVSETDYIGVMAFDDSYDRIVPLQKVTDRDMISNKIFSIGIDGGTSIYPALMAGATDIMNCDAMIKHIILLTDGEDTIAKEEYDELLDTMKASGTTLSTVSVGSETNNVLLEYLAQKGGGRYYSDGGDSNIPRIFAQEVFLSSNTYLVNETFTPVVCANDYILKGILADELPKLYGYIATTPKERSIQVLQSPEKDPILAYWQYGLGKSVAWTSDVTGEWSREYASWENNPLLWHNIIELLEERTSQTGAYAEVLQEGNKAEINYTTQSFGGDTSVVAYVSNDRGESFETNLTPVSPGVYSGDFEMEHNGVYSINIKQYDAGAVSGNTITAAVMQYSMEYRLFPENTLLDEYVELVGGTLLDAPTGIFEQLPENITSRKNMALPLLIFAIFYFIWDIAYRRFKINLFFSKVPKTAVSREEAVKQEQVVAASEEHAHVRSVKPDKRIKKENKTAKAKTERKPQPERLDTAALLKGLEERK